MIVPAILLVAVIAGAILWIRHENERTFWATIRASAKMDYDTLQAIIRLGEE